MQKRINGKSGGLQAGFELIVRIKPLEGSKVLPSK